jgi:hypothetical protein
MCAFLSPAAALVLSVAAWCGAGPLAPDAVRVRQLVERLDDDSFDVRQQADAELRRLGRPVLPLLEAALPSAPSLEVRWRLGRILDLVGGDERRARLLVQQLGDDSYTKREEADRELRKMGKKALAAIEAIPVEDPEVLRRLNHIRKKLAAESEE